MASSQTPIGIDLGTTFSAIAYLDNEGRPCTIANSEGELTTPSVVFFDRDAIIVGTEAAIAGEGDVARLARAAKRDMGGARYRNRILDRHLPPEVIQSFVLRRLKEDAALKLGPFTQAVVTVPAYFNEPRRKATQDAGELAGLDVIDIINEPTAAALAYGVQRGFLSDKGESRQRELVLVYDLGGGTFDVTLMEIDHNRFRALATAGDVYLGGIDWDQRLFEFAKEEIASRHGVDFDSDPVLHEKLMNQCVRAKKSLTARTETVIRIEHEGERFTISVNRPQFEELTNDLLERTRLTTDRLLRDVELQWSDLTKLLLVGGSTRMPMVLEMLERESGLQVDRSLSPDEAVAHGAAIYAGILMNHGPSAGAGISVSNVNSHDLGVLGIDPQTRQPRRKIVIPRNHQLPAKSAKKFQTSKDGQQKIVVQIVEGGTDEGLGSTTIGKCVVQDLPQHIMQGTEIVVSFNYLSSGRLEVLAQIPSLNLSADSTIDRATGMTEEQISNWKKKLAQGPGFLEREPKIEPQPTKTVKPSATPPVKSDRQQIVATNGKSKNKSKNKSKHPIESAASQDSKSDGKKANVAKIDPPKSKPGRKTVAKKPTVEKPIPATTSPPKLAGKRQRAKSRADDFEVDEHSGIFAFGDEDAKPEVGTSVLGILQQNQEDSGKSATGESILDFLKQSGDGKQKPGPGDSVLDFLNKTTEKKPTASDSALEDFLSELDE